MECIDDCVDTETETADAEVAMEDVVVNEVANVVVVDIDVAGIDPFDPKSEMKSML